MLSRLFRLRLSLMNGVTALGGYLLLGGYPEEGGSWAMWAAGTGVALLACAGSAFNQVLEREFDALMLRTRTRPLPTGRLSARVAACLGGLLFAAGLALLGAAGGLLPALLGSFALAWYLAVYTPLKRRTPFALAVGALSGALPPVIGWCVAGGSPADFRVLLLAGILYLWQIPHFWVLQRRHAEDYRRAGFPVFDLEAHGELLFRLWLVALVAGALMLPAFGIVGRGAAPWCAAFLAPLVATSVRRLQPALFACLNLFPVLVSLALCAGR